MSWLHNRKKEAQGVANQLHDCRQAISALINHVEDKDPLSDLEVDMVKHQIESALSKVR